MLRFSPLRYNISFILVLVTLMDSTTTTAVDTLPTLSLSYIMSEAPLRTDTQLLERLTSHNPLVPLPKPRSRDAEIAHAPKRTHGLSREGKKVCEIMVFTCY